MKFSYRARTKEGKIEVGTVEAASKEAAALLLQKYNIFVTSLEQASIKIPLLQMRIERKVSSKELAIFFRQLCVMLESRVPVVQSLQGLASQTKKNKFKEIITKVSNLVEEGVPLSEAFGHFPKVFDPFYVNLIKSGEASGNIAGSLGYIAEHVERENDIVSQLRQAMVYPMFVLVVLVVVLIIIMTMVMPRIVDIINESTTAPPLSTKIVLAVYSILQNYWWLLLALLVVFVIGVILYLRTPQGKDAADRGLLKLPLLGIFFKKVFLTRFCGNISTLVIAGISINKALAITQDTVNNVAYKEIIAQIEREVSEGEKMSSVMQQHEDYFPPFVVQMIKVGEETGKLDSILQEIVVFYQKEIKRSIDFFTSLIEPIMIIFLGVVVGILAVSVLSPLYGALGSV